MTKLSELDLILNSARREIENKFYIQVVSMSVLKKIKSLHDITTMYNFYAKFDFNLKELFKSNNIRAIFTLTQDLYKWIVLMDFFRLSCYFVINQ